MHRSSPLCESYRGFPKNLVKGNQERMNGEIESPVHHPLPIKINLFLVMSSILRGCFKEASFLVG